MGRAAKAAADPRVRRRPPMHASRRASDRGASRGRPTAACVAGERLKRFVAVLARLQHLTLVLQAVEGGGDGGAGLGGVDDGVDVAALGGDVGVEQPLA